MGRPVRIEDDENGGDNSSKNAPHMTTGYTSFTTSPMQSSDPGFYNSERSFDYFHKERNGSVMVYASQHGEPPDNSSKRCLGLKRSLSQFPTRNSNPHKILKLANERSVVEEAHQDHNSHRGPLTESNPHFLAQRCPKDDAAAQPDAKSSHEEMEASSLHTLAMACEKITASTKPSSETSNRPRRSAPRSRAREQLQVTSSNVPPPLPNSQDVTKPYSNLSNEWVVPSTPTPTPTALNDNVLPANSDLSVTSPISINDVLCGRGGLTNHHPGNIFFRKLVRHYQESYLLATKRDKAGVAKGIVDTIRSLQPPGRFLKKARDVSANGVWVEIGDRKAREKTSQALRERAPELREELECQVRQQQQPYLNVVSSDEKTLLDFRRNPAVGGVVVLPKLSNALVGPNVVLSRDSISTPENVQSSSQKDHVNNDSFPSTQHDSHENKDTLLQSRPNTLSRGVTLDSIDNVHSLPGVAVAVAVADHWKINKYSSPDNHEKMGNSIVESNMILRRKETVVDSVRSSDLIRVDIDTLTPTHDDDDEDVLSRENISQRHEEKKSIKAQNLCGRPTAIPLMTPSIPCSFQANAGIRTISSSEDDFCVKHQKGGNDNAGAKSSRGGPRIKTLKERIQNVL